MQHKNLTLCRFMHIKIEDIKEKTLFLLNPFYIKLNVKMLALTMHLHSPYQHNTQWKLRCTNQNINFPHI